VLLVDYCIVIGIADYDYGWWHGSSCVLLVDFCIIIETDGLHGGSLCSHQFIVGYDTSNSCLLLRVVVYHWTLVVYYYGSTQSCSTRWHCSSCVLLADFHGDYQITLGVVVCY
jgi:hypothetical protein